MPCSLKSPELSDKVTKAVYNESQKSLYLLTADGFLNAFKVSEENQELEFLNAQELTQHLQQDSLRAPIAIFVQNFYDNIFVLFDDGECLKLSAELEFRKLKKVFEGESRIIAAEASPNEEHFVLVTGEGSVLMFDKHFELERSEKLKSVPDEHPLLECCVVWRFDSEYFAVNYRSKDGGQAMTFTRDLKKFHSESYFNPEYELVKNVFERPDQTLQSLTAWVPNGSLLYGVRRLETAGVHKTTILSWEKNGLHYKEFDLPSIVSKDSTILKILFNKDSSVMTIWVRPTEGKNRLLIYLRSNADWHFKSSLELPPIAILHATLTGSSIQLLAENEVIIIHFSVVSHTFHYLKAGLANQQ